MQEFSRFLNIRTPLQLLHGHRDNEAGHADFPPRRLGIFQLFSPLFRSGLPHDEQRGRYGSGNLNLEYFSPFGTLAHIHVNQAAHRVHHFHAAPVRRNLHGYFRNPFPFVQLVQAVRMAPYAHADSAVLGRAGQGTGDFRPGRRIQPRTVPAADVGIYFHRPSDRLDPVLRNAGKIFRRRARLQGGKLGVLPFPAFFQKLLHAPGVIPAFPRGGSGGEFLHSRHFSALSQDHVSSGLSLSA